MFSSMWGHVLYLSILFRRKVLETSIWKFSSCRGNLSFHLIHIIWRLMSGSYIRTRFVLFTNVCKQNLDPYIFVKSRQTICFHKVILRFDPLFNSTRSAMLNAIAYCKIFDSRIDSFRNFGPNVYVQSLQTILFFVFIIIL